MVRQLRYKFSVRGSVALPIDMLRYDQCWPATEVDAKRAAASIRFETEGSVTIELRGPRRPTLARWESFGWRVIEGSIAEYRLP